MVFVDCQKKRLYRVLTPVFYTVAGLITLYSPFSLVYILATFALSVFFAFCKCPKAWKRKTAAVWYFATGATLLWVSLIASYRGLEPTNILQPFGKGGFPFEAFQYPVPPMGNDVPPLAMWPTFFVNQAVWFFVAVIIIQLLSRRVPILRHGGVFAVIAGMVVSLTGLGYVVFRFD